MHVKICGITSVEVAVACGKLGANALGLNFVPGSPRCISVDQARAISRAVRDTDVQVVGVVADLDIDEMRTLAKDAELDALQLHGDESPETLESLLPHAYKAVRVANRDDVERARFFSGDPLLVDAKSEGALGGTGKTFDWTLVKELARQRKIILAGGLKADNVAEAVLEVEPWGVDVASGVEGTPGVKDLDKVRSFIAEAHVRRRR